MWGNRIFKLIGPLSALLLSACVSSPPPASPAAQDQASARRLQDYQLGPADKVRIIVYQEPELSGEFSISATGAISFPLLGDIPAEGMTVQQLRDRLAADLSKGYLNDARVAAEVLAYRPYYILGEIGEPGEYPYSAEMTVMKAVAAAGGFSYRARKSSVLIKRANADQEERYQLTHDLMVYPGDIIRVGERFF